MFYFEYKRKRFDKVDQLTLKEVQELLESIKGLKLKYERKEETQYVK